MAAEWRYTKEGLFELIWEGICVMRAHGEGRHRDGRKIDTRTARLVEQKKAERGQAGQDRAGQKAKKRKQEQWDFLLWVLCCLFFLRE